MHKQNLAGDFGSRGNFGPGGSGRSFNNQPPSLNLPTDMGKFNYAGAFGPTGNPGILTQLPGVPGFSAPSSIPFSPLPLAQPIDTQSLFRAQGPLIFSSHAPMTIAPFVPAAAPITPDYDRAVSYLKCSENNSGGLSCNRIEPFPQQPAAPIVPAHEKAMLDSLRNRSMFPPGILDCAFQKWAVADAAAEGAVKGLVTGAIASKTIPGTLIGGVVGATGSTIAGFSAESKRVGDCEAQQAEEKQRNGVR